MFGLLVGALVKGFTSVGTSVGGGTDSCAPGFLRGLLLGKEGADGGDLRAGGAYGRTARWRATAPPARSRQATSAHPAAAIRRASAGWSGQARIDSAR